MKIKNMNIICIYIYIYIHRIVSKHDSILTDYLRYEQLLPKVISSCNSRYVTYSLTSSTDI